MKEEDNKEETEEKGKEKSLEQMKQILNEAEEDLGIIFPPSYIKIMQVKSLSLKDCISGSACTEDSNLVKQEKAQNSNISISEDNKIPKIIKKEGFQNIKTPLIKSRTNSKEEMLKELRDFIIEKNKIKVEYKEEDTPWINKKKPIETNHNITAVRFEKKEVGDIISM